MRHDANVGCHQVGLQTTDQLMLGAISRLEGAQGQRWKSGHPKERERTHSAASHAEGRHARWGGVVLPRVTTELVKAWSINRH